MYIETPDGLFVQYEGGQFIDPWGRTVQISGIQKIHLGKWKEPFNFSQDDYQVVTEKSGSRELVESLIALLNVSEEDKSALLRDLEQQKLI